MEALNGSLVAHRRLTARIDLKSNIQVSCDWRGAKKISRLNDWTRLRVVWMKLI
jgi:hypothetical protein